MPFDFWAAVTVEHFLFFDESFFWGTGSQKMENTDFCPGGKERTNLKHSCTEVDYDCRKHASSLKTTLQSNGVNGHFCTAMFMHVLHLNCGQLTLQAQVVWTVSCLTAAAVPPLLVFLTRNICRGRDWEPYLWLACLGHKGPRLGF